MGEAAMNLSDGVVGGTTQMKGSLAIITHTAVDLLQGFRV